MKKLTFFLLLMPLALLPAQSRPTSQPPSQAKALVFTHVTVIDATGAEARPEMTVVITGDRITALGAARKVNIPRNAHVVDAAGKFFIPGLWDMHTHLAVPVANKAANKEIYLPLLIANGVTGVRDMFSELETINQWRKEIAAGTLLGPSLVAAGEILD
ncbi:MAG: amidohydrolase family protein, partial [Pyrinomonadaceae bacterium]